MAFVLKKVLISDEIDERCIDVLKKNGVDVTKNTKLTKEQLIQEIGQYDGLIVRSATKVTADVIAAGTRLRIIGRAGTGVDNIDTDAATKHGVIVMNTPGGNTMSAAELTCTLIMATARHIAAGCASLKAGRWDRKKYMGNEVLGKTLAIVGLGRIGKEVASRMQAFGMTTIGYDPITPASVAQSWGIEWMELEKVWPLADYITVHTPLIPQTKNLINDEVFGKCKPGVKIINCARGGIVDEDALLRALQSGQCGGAGLDVFLEEPPQNRALVDHERVTCTPHLGASTEEAQSRVAVEIAEQFIDVVNGKSLFGAINAQSMSTDPATTPWIALGSGLGSIAAAVNGPVDSTASVTLTTQGESLVKAGSYLGAALVVGLLGNTSNNGLNLVSAPGAAAAAGIKLNVTHNASGAAGLVSVVIQSGEVSTVQLTGTVASGVPVLVSVNGAALGQALSLEDTIVLAQADKKGMAGLAGAVCESGSELKAFSTAGSSGWVALKVAPALANVSSLNAKAAYQVTF